MVTTLILAYTPALGILILASMHTDCEMSLEYIDCTGIVSKQIFI